MLENRKSRYFSKFKMVIWYHWSKSIQSTVLRKTYHSKLDSIRISTDYRNFKRMFGMPLPQKLWTFSLLTIPHSTHATLWSTHRRVCTDHSFIKQAQTSIKRWTISTQFWTLSTGSACTTFLSPLQRHTPTPPDFPCSANVSLWRYAWKCSPIQSHARESQFTLFSKFKVVLECPRSKSVRIAGLLKPTHGFSLWKSPFCQEWHLTSLRRMR